jgi:hypothetical protein
MHQKILLIKGYLQDIVMHDLVVVGRDVIGIR